MKDRMLITGGQALEGTVQVSGGKNTAVAVIPATLLCDEPCTIENLPDIEDVHALVDILRELGAEVDYEPGHMLRVDPRPAEGSEVSYANAQRLRASYYFLGALLGRCGHAKVPTPGGCEIGSRPVDQHLKGFQALGAEAEELRGVLTAECTELTGGDVFFDMVTVGATVNVLLAAVRARGITVIENAAREPHIVDLANFLNLMGADIMGAGTDVIKIRGVQDLHACDYSIIPDQIEAGTYMVAAAATKGDLLIKNVIPKHLEPITAKLRECGAMVDEYDDAVRVYATGRLHGCNVKTMPHPGFPTDMQPQFTVLLSLCEGISIVTDSVWDNRFRYVDQLTRMGAQIQIEGKAAIVQGSAVLKGAPVKADDLRAGAAMIIAGLCAKGTTEIEDIIHIDRGYEDVVKKLTAVGASIARMEFPDPNITAKRA